MRAVMIGTAGSSKGVRREAESKRFAERKARLGPDELKSDKRPA